MDGIGCVIEECDVKIKIKRDHGDLNTKYSKKPSSYNVESKAASPLQPGPWSGSEVTIE